MKTSRRLGILRHVDDDQPVVPVHLGCGKADARGGVHGLEHVVDAPFKGGIENGHRHGLGAQPRVRIFKDGKQGHGSCLDSKMLLMFKLM